MFDPLMKDKIRQCYVVWLSHMRYIWDLSLNLSSMRSCFSHMNSQVTNVIAMYFVSVPILPKHFISYFSTILNYLQR